MNIVRKNLGEVKDIEDLKTIISSELNTQGGDIWIAGQLRWTPELHKQAQIYGLKKKEPEKVWLPPTFFKKWAEIKDIINPGYIEDAVIFSPEWQIRLFRRYGKLQASLLKETDDINNSIEVVCWNLNGNDNLSIELNTKEKDRFWFAYNLGALNKSESHSFFIRVYADENGVVDWRFIPVLKEGKNG